MKCPYCGAEVDLKRDHGRCQYCGSEITMPAEKEQAPVIQVTNNNYYQEAPHTAVRNTTMRTVSSKDKFTAELLCLFLGFFGVHMFYAGRLKMGILYFCTFGLLGFGWLADIIIIATGNFKDGDGELVLDSKVDPKTRKIIWITLAVLFVADMIAGSIHS